MCDDTLASLNKLNRELENIVRRNMRVCVTDYLQGLCTVDHDFAKLVLNDGKNMRECFRYITKRARKYAEEEYGRENIADGCDVPDGLCYEWAVEYFKFPDEKLKDMGGVKDSISDGKDARENNESKVSSANRVNQIKQHKVSRQDKAQLSFDDLITGMDNEEVVACPEELDE